MYNISDRTNLKTQDKALKSFTGKFGVFSHKMLTRAEIKNSKTQRLKTPKGSIRSERSEAVSDIWQSFTVPIKFRIPSRR